MLDRLRSLYVLRLGRNPDGAGFATFGAAITLGTKTWRDVDQALASSAEGRAFAALPPAEQVKRRSRIKV